jgi:hypothetical protein
MAKVKISEFDVNPDNNTDINNINIAEGCAPSGINNAIRQLMSDLKEFQTGAGGDPFNGAVNGTVGATTPATGAFTTLSASSTVSGTGFSTYLASPPAIGGTAASTGAFTSLSASGAFSANGGTTLGDASGDALTINSSAVSIPNGLNFDSNTFVIDATNNRVGINVASPIAPLQVVSSGTSLCQFTGAQYSQVRHSDGTRVFLTQVYDNLGILGMESNTPLMIMTNNAERMRITSAGNVGIGTSSPQAILHIQATQASMNLRSTGTGSPFIDFYTSSSSLVGNFYALNGGGLVWGTSGGTERMRLSDSGNLGLGVTPSAGWAGYRAMQVGTGASFGGYVGDVLSFVGSNCYNDNTNWRYLASANLASRYQQSAGIHQWYTAPSGTAGNAITFTQAMTLDASGNLGLGTTTPTTRLDVNGIGRFRREAQSNQYTEINSQGGESYIDAVNGSSATYQSIAFRSGNNAGTLERMRIDSSGNLLVGTTTQSGKAVIVAGVNQNTLTLVNPTFNYNPLAIHNQGTSGDNFFVGFGTESSFTTRGTIDYNRGAGQTRYNTTSDATLKNLIGDSDKQKSVDILKSTKIREYAWKDDAEQKSQIGVIAQELYETYKGAVTVGGEKEDGKYQPWGVDKTAFTFHLIAGWQEHQRIIQEQQAIINDLKARIETLESK